MSHSTAALIVVGIIVATPVLAIVAVVASLIRRRLRRPKFLPAPSALALRTSQTDFNISERTGARYI